MFYFLLIILICCSLEELREKFDVLSENKAVKSDSTSVIHYVTQHDKGYYRWFSACPPSREAILELSIVHYNVSNHFPIESISISIGEFFLQFVQYSHYLNYRGQLSAFFAPIIETDFDLYGNFDGTFAYSFEFDSKEFKKSFSYAFNKQNCDGDSYIFAGNPELNFFSDEELLSQVQTLPISMKEIYVKLTVERDESFDFMNVTGIVIFINDVVKGVVNRHDLIEGVDYNFVSSQTTEDYEISDGKEYNQRAIHIVGNYWRGVFFKWVQFRFYYYSTSIIAGEDTPRYFAYTRIIERKSDVNWAETAGLMVVINITLFLSAMTLFALIVTAVCVISKRRILNMPRFF